MVLATKNKKYAEKHKQGEKTFIFRVLNEKLLFLFFHSRGVG
jgi:hypothetical protein